MRRMMTMKGIDISGFQEGIKLADAKKAGHDFVIIYAGKGNVISQKGACFDAQIKDAIENKMKIGAYWFSYAISADDARKEADVCAAVIEKWKANITLPIFFDWEYDSEDYAKKHGVTPTKTLITSMTIAFIDRMKAHGYEAGYYTNPDYLSRYYDYEQMKKYPLWLAQYEGQAKYPYTIRQTSSTGKIPGYNGSVDLDEMDAAKPAPEKTYKEIRITYHDILPEIAKAYGSTEDALLKLNGASKNGFVVAVKVPLKSVDDIAREVIAGKWGSWPFRSGNLKRAGYDPEAVQDRVNQMLKGK